MNDSQDVSVLLFARAAELAGADRLTISRPGTVAELRSAIVGAAPALEQIAPSLLVAVDGAYAADDDAIGPAAEVAVFPPVSGG